MPRTRRICPGGLCYHVINRGNQKARVYHSADDYRSFIGLFPLANRRTPMRMLAFCLMPNHFHLVLWPHHDGDLSRWMHWLLTTHVRRYHKRHETCGHLWQDRFKSFPIQRDEHLLTVLRYVERNPLRAGLVNHAVDWPWSSLSRALALPGSLHPGPLRRCANWASYVDQPLTAQELEALRNCVRRNAPFGNKAWAEITAHRMGIDSTLRPRGRPQKGDCPLF